MRGDVYLLLSGFRLLDCWGGVDRGVRDVRQAIAPLPAPEIAGQSLAATVQHVLATPMPEPGVVVAAPVASRCRSDQKALSGNGPTVVSSTTARQLERSHSHARPPLIGATLRPNLQRADCMGFFESYRQGGVGDVEDSDGVQKLPVAAVGQEQSLPILWSVPDIVRCCALEARHRAAATWTGTGERRPSASWA